MESTRAHLEALVAVGHSVDSAKAAEKMQRVCKQEERRKRSIALRVCRNTRPIETVSRARMHVR